MTLTLIAVSLNERPLSQPITAHFDNRGGTIGRADHNTMALPDPERHVSRLQAEIVATGDHFMIRNVGSANPIMVAGRPLASGESVLLSHGEEVRIGGYLLQVDTRGDGSALDITRGRAMLSSTLTPSPVALSEGLRRAPVAPAASEAMAATWPPSVAPAVGPANTPAAPVPLPAAKRQALAPSPSPSPSPSPLAPAGAAQNPFADLLGDVAAPAAAPASARVSVSDDPFADLFGSPLQAGSSSLTPRPAPAPAPPATPSVAPAPEGAVGTPATAAGFDPFADLIPPAAGLPAKSAGLAPASAPPSARLPDDFDPFADLAPAKASSTGPATRDNDPFADLMPHAAPSSIDAMFGLEPRDTDPLAAFMAGAAPAAAQGSPPSSASGRLDGGSRLSVDPMEALFGDAAPAPATAAESNHVPALKTAFSPPRVRSSDSLGSGAAALPQADVAPQPVSAAAPVRAAKAAPPQPAAAPPVRAPVLAPAAPPARVAATPLSELPGHEQAALRLWAALCEGAGVDIPLPAADAEERMHEVGRVLRSAVDGILRLMAVRASTKSELRADVTVIQARGNNPLKFSPDAAAGISHLLQPTVQGFLPGAAAMDDAMHDLVGHSIGTVAGMRAALGGMLDRFAPEELESKLTTRSMLESLLPATRKARLWDAYLQHHGDIRDDAQDDFHNLFGKAFLAAYDQQIAQLRRTGSS